MTTFRMVNFISYKNLALKRVVRKEKVGAAPTFSYDMKSIAF